MSVVDTISAMKVQPWNRITMADGQWLQEKTIQQLDARDIELAKAIDEVQLDLNTKIENIGCYIKNLEAEVEAFKKEEDNLEARRKQTERTSVMAGCSEERSRLCR